MSEYQISPELKALYEAEARRGRLFEVVLYVILVYLGVLTVATLGYLGF